MSRRVAAHIRVCPVYKAQREEQIKNHVQQMILKKQYWNQRWGHRMGCDDVSILLKNILSIHNFFISFVNNLQEEEMEEEDESSAEELEILP